MAGLCRCAHEEDVVSLAHSPPKSGICACLLVLLTQVIPSVVAIEAGDCHTHLLWLLCILCEVIECCCDQLSLLL